jgi:spore coat protein A
MKVPRRALVASGARFAAALAVAPGLIRLPGCRTAPFSRAVPAGEPSAERLCSSRVTGPPDRPLPRQPLHPDSLPRFVDRLPVPRVLRPSGTRPHPDKPRAAPVPVFRVAMKATEVRVHRDLPPTRMWGYEGEVPGPTIAVRRGEPLFVEWANELPERHFLPIDRTLHGAHEGAPEVRTVVHVHGAKAPPESDGYPESWFLAGSAATAFYPNDQEATTLWYHDHTMGIERLNQYAGLFGFFLIREAAEAEAASSLPHGAYDIPLALCDRLFDVDAQLVYPTSGRTRGPWVSEVLGDAHLVNGKLAPFVEVEPRRYRLRVLNASNSRFYYLSLTDDQPMWQVGTDQGLLSAPVSLQRKMIAPGERVDLVVDFRHLSGREAYLQNQTTKLLQFRVGTMKSPGEAPMPTTLRTLPRIEARAAVRTRTLTLKEHVDPATAR